MWLYRCLWLVAALAAPEPGAVQADSLEILQPLNVAVADGNATIDLPAARAPRKYLVIVGSLARSSTPSQVSIRVQVRPEAAPIEQAVDVRDPAWVARVEQRRHQMQQRRALARRGADQYVAARFPIERSFYLYVGDGDLFDPGQYEKVAARLVAVGKRCLIYVDEQDDPEGFSREILSQITEMFDREVYPKASLFFGKPHDVDRNGRFTILLSGWLGMLSGGTVSLGGFVRGGDFQRDLPEPFGNQCDMMYLNSNVRSLEHLRNLLAHEYVHAVTFSEHVFGDYLPESSGSDEEAWLNEAISHLAENLIGEGWSNLDYRISAYLSQTNRYRLVVEDYFREGLWRCHGSRGATYLFLRWCVDRFGVGMLRELAQSGLVGVENLETATQTPFAELFRQWSIAVCLDANVPAGGAGRGFRSLALRGRLGACLLAGPLALSASPGTWEMPLAGTSFLPVEVRVPEGEIRRLSISADPAAQLQVTVVRLPDELPEVDVLVERRAGDGAGEVAVRLRHHAGQAVEWHWLSWERRSLPQTKTLPAQRQRRVFSVKELVSQQRTQPGSQWRTVAIELPQAEEADYVIKVLGRDSAGRPVVAWGLYHAKTSHPATLRVGSTSDNDIAPARAPSTAPRATSR